METARSATAFPPTSLALSPSIVQDDFKGKKDLRIDSLCSIPVMRLQELLRALLVHLRDLGEVGNRLVLRGVWHRGG